MVRTPELILDHYRTARAEIPSEHVKGVPADLGLDLFQLKLQAEDLSKRIEILREPGREMTSLVRPHTSSVHRRQRP